MSTHLHRVVVTGIGAVSCFGLGAQTAWRNLLAGRSGIVSIKDSAFTKISSKVYGKVPLVGQSSAPDGVEIQPMDLSKYASKGELREVGPATVFAYAATEEAMRDAGFSPQSEAERDRTGIVVGMSFLDMQEMANASIESERVGHYNRMSPYFLPRILLNMPGARTSIRFGLRGVQYSATTACSIGAHSIGDAFRLLRAGKCDAIIAGGVEACLNPLIIGGFAKMRALSTRYNDRPHLASRPFDAEHDGFVIAEGCGVMVMETLEHYQKRTRGQKPRIYAEVLGYGMSSDGYHISSPLPDGGGARRSMLAALRDAKLTIGQVSAVNCHATSTPTGDSIEVRAIADLLNTDKTESARTVFINSTKGATGHLIGASGAIESVFTVLQCREKMVAPCVNLHKVEDSIQQLVDRFNASHKAQLRFVGAGDSKPQEWKSQGRRIALKNSFGFGGTNASLCFASFDETSQ